MTTFHQVLQQSLWGWLSFSCQAFYWKFWITLRLLTIITLFHQMVIL